jgi:hypothetical protein
MYFPSVLQSGDAGSNRLWQSGASNGTSRSHTDAFTTKEISRINNCKLYLKAVTIADLSTACGTRLDPYFLDGKTSLLGSTTKWISTNQQRSGEPASITWHQAM